MSVHDGFSRDEAQALTARVLALSTADEARVNLQSGRRGNTRWAGNGVSTGGDIADAGLVVTSAFGKRVASATTNQFDDASLRRAVETSERLARLVPENPEYVGQLGPQTVPEPQAFVASTAGLDPEARAAAVAEVSRRASARGLVSTGFLPFEAGQRAVATSRGLFAYDRTTAAALTTTVRTPEGDGSGWAGAAATDWTDVDPAALAERAIEKAERSRGAEAVEPGRWTVVLEPSAVGSMLGLLMGSLSARQADEGRSFFARPGGGTRLGERFVDERVRITSDPLAPGLFSTPFSDEGLPNRPTTWVENGALQNLIYDRFWAQEKGREPTGFPAGYAMAGGDATVDEMIASTERGLLVTRLWYIRSVDPRAILFTGLTRDGTFLIEDGRVTRAVKNLRWNESPVAMLNGVEAMGRPVRVPAGESGEIGSSVVVPPLKLSGFTFTSVSDAV